jgi:monothiol glutaredoxin
MPSSEPQPVRDLPLLDGELSPTHGPAASAGGSGDSDRVRHAPPSAGELGANPIRDAIAETIAEHRVILFMKGTPEAPACGFSARTVAVLQALDAPFAAVDVLPDPRIRQELSAISNWPTIPQLFVGGELVGGCDIVTEMYESGELAQALL